VMGRPSTSVLRIQRLQHRLLRIYSEASTPFEQILDL
jgi:hypothetical protein